MVAKQLLLSNTSTDKFLDDLSVAGQTKACLLSPHKYAGYVIAKVWAHKISEVICDFHGAEAIYLPLLIDLVHRCDATLYVMSPDGTEKINVFQVLEYDTDI